MRRFFAFHAQPHLFPALLFDLIQPLGGLVEELGVAAWLVVDLQFVRIADSHNRQLCGLEVLPGHFEVMITSDDSSTTDE